MQIRSGVPIRQALHVPVDDTSISDLKIPSLGETQSLLNIRISSSDGDQHTTGYGRSLIQEVECITSADEKKINDFDQRNDPGILKF